MTVTKIAKKFRRCLEFTLSDGSVVAVKVMGDRGEAVTKAQALVDALTRAAQVEVK